MTDLSRREFLTGLLGATAVLSTSNRLFAQEDPTDQRPNIVFILADDLGWADVNCYGHRFHETPHIDRLAAAGMRFTDAYAACPVCSPTRASIMTGKYPATLGLTDWIPGWRSRPDQKLLAPEFLHYLPLEEVTIAEALKLAGYTTGSVGKWHLGGEGYLPENQGFDVNIAGTHLGSPAGGYFLPNKMNLKDMKPGEYLTDRLTDEGIAFIRNNSNRPFFLYQSYHSVHTPIQAKKAYVEKYKAKLGPNEAYNPAYAGMVQSLDEGVGRILQTLDDLRIGERTVVFFMSDNGGLDRVTDNAPLRAGKGHIYEGGIREPMIVLYPRLVKAGAVCPVPVSSVDFYPSILDLAGVKGDAKHTPDGVSLAPLLKGEPSLERGSIFWHYPHYSPQGGRPAAAVRCGDFKLVKFFEDNRIELYDLRSDMGEQNDLSEKQTEKAAELQRVLEDWLKRVNAKMPTPNPRYDPNAGISRKAKEQPKGTRPQK